MPKIVDPLSDTQIADAKTDAKEVKLFDGGGLYLLVHPSGGKWWRLKYRFDGKAKQLALGFYPETSLDDARSKRDAARVLLRDGIDPRTLSEEEKIRRKTETLEASKQLSVRITLDGKIELWKGRNVMFFTWDEARFIADTLRNIVR